jgi:hypothetical protein
VKHLHRYLSEFQFQWNHRDSPEICIAVVAALRTGTALRYQVLIAVAEGDQNASGQTAHTNNDDQPF